MQFDQKSDAFSCNWILPNDPRESAAALLIFETKNQTEILVIRRSTLVRSHAGQISFPGGRRESSDSTPLQTALRECEEEIGIPQSEILPLGFANPTQGNDGSWIHVLIAKTNFSEKNLKINAEVERIHMISEVEFHRENAKDFAFTLFGTRRKSKYFETSQCKVWGLTAKMIYDANLRRFN